MLHFLVCLPQTLNPFLEVLWRKLLMKSEGVWWNGGMITVFKIITALCSNG